MASVALSRSRSSSRSERGHVSASRSTRTTGTKNVGETHFVPLITEAAVAQGISEALNDLSAKQIAKATEVSVETAKAWRAEDRCPHTANTINMARSFPPVNEWLAEQCGWSVAARAASKDEVIRWASQNYSAPGQDGAIARAVLREAASQHT